VNPTGELTRRRVLAALAAVGVGSATFRRAVAADAARQGDVTPEMLRQAEWVAGLELSDEDRESTAKAVTRTLREIETLRGVPLANDVPLALTFNPAPWRVRSTEANRGSVELIERAAPQRPQRDEDLAFLPVAEQAALLRTRRVTSSELTELYLDRLMKFDPLLKCVVTLTADRARQQARQADREIAAGRYRGPLHGVPWGAKDLMAVPGYPTTWGAPPFREQRLDTTATAVRRLDEAGAVLVAKLSLGALAMGDQWFGGQTKNPWNLKQGSSGSSAGSAAATAAGLVGFAIGSETHGSILSPARRCGVTGLRPTYGRVSRHGCMTLAWSLDKIGPLCRTVEDCALVFGAIHGADGLDSAAVDEPFDWPCQRDVATLRIGYVETDRSEDERGELQVLRDLGATLVPVRLPKHLPIGEMLLTLDCEAAAVFDDLTRNNVTDGLNSWPGIFRQAEFVPAVEYIRANRVRTLLLHAMREAIRSVDVYVGGDDLSLTNLTGHPSISLPNGFRDGKDGREPTAITFTGQLYGESTLLAVAHAFQQATGHHLERPELAVPAE
jgi:Asp-tRNA(Asn)/Glu-tRNA(Gln) amidotransferase A subunit family amidase